MHVRHITFSKTCPARIHAWILCNCPLWRAGSLTDPPQSTGSRLLKCYLAAMMLRDFSLLVGDDLRLHGTCVDESSIPRFCEVLLLPDFIGGYARPDVSEIRQDVLPDCLAFSPGTCLFLQLYIRLEHLSQNWNISFIVQTYLDSYVASFAHFPSSALRRPLSFTSR